MSKNRALAAATALVIAGTAAATPAHTAAADPLPPTSGDPLPPTEPTTSSSPDDVAVDQTLNASGQVVSTATYDAAGRAAIERPDGSVVHSAGDGSGSGGTSSASGCRKVTVRNRGESVLGYLVYRYNTWTEWCWNRADRSITSVKTGEYLSDVASSMYYRGVVTKNEEFYAWRSGYNKSGHWHARQSHWENCVAKYGCISSDYPRNSLRAHSDGTYSWATYD